MSVAIIIMIIREGSDPEHDKENFTKLSQELAAALHAKGKLFTAAMSADNKRLDVKQILYRIKYKDGDFEGWLRPPCSG